MGKYVLHSLNLSFDESTLVSPTFHGKICVTFIEFIV